MSAQGVVARRNRSSQPIAAMLRPRSGLCRALGRATLAFCAMAVVASAGLAWATERNVDYKHELRNNKLAARPVWVQLKQPVDGHRTHVIIPANAPKQVAQRARELAKEFGHKVHSGDKTGVCPKLPNQILDVLAKAVEDHRREHGQVIDLGHALAAGLGTRFGKAVAALQKEMMTVHTAPLVHHGVQMYVDGGSPIVLTSFRWGRNGEAVLRHFDPKGNPDLDANLKSKSDPALYKDMQRGRQMAHMIFVPQLDEATDPYGTAIPTAVALPVVEQLHQHAGAKTFGLTYTDDRVIQNRADVDSGKVVAATKQLMIALTDARQALPGLEIAAANGVKLLPAAQEAEPFGIAIPDHRREGKLRGYEEGKAFWMAATGIHEKPSVAQMFAKDYVVNQRFLPQYNAKKARDWVAGSYGLFAVDMGKMLKAYGQLAKGKDGEFWFIDVVNGATGSGDMIAVQPANTLWMPTGNPVSYLQAQFADMAAQGMFTEEQARDVFKQLRSAGLAN